MAGNFAVQAAFELAPEQGDIGRCTAHVEADQFFQPRRLADLGHADQAAGRTGQDAVLALEVCGRNQAAIRLHEFQLDPCGQGVDDLIGIAPHRR